MKVVFFHRKPFAAGNFSVEGAFQIIREAMPKDVETFVAQSRFVSRGVLRRLYNCIEAAFRQGDVNHITGDVHFLSYFLIKKKTLLTILDCVFTQNPSALKRYILRLFWYIIPEKRVALISVISQATKNELLKYISCDPDKIRVIPVTISQKFIFKEKEFDNLKPRILQIGTAPNKNLIRLFEALYLIPCKLDIVGKLSLEHITMLEHYKIDYTNSWNLSEQEIISKYHECDIVSFISTYEGFGMPILEANAVGRPVITSDILSMPEVAGNAACLVSPFKVSEIRSGFLRIISDEHYRKQLVNNGLNNVLRFKPSIISEQYLELYREILRSG